MDTEEELRRLRGTVERLRRSRTLLLRLLDKSLQEQAALQAQILRRGGLSNVRQMTPGSAQDKAPRT